MSSSSSSSRRPTTSSPLHKGTACLNCRRRKIKCDGVKPKCGPCSASDGFRDCEYADGGITQTQLLEEKIALLEAKIQELENPAYANASVMLSQPYNMLVGPSNAPEQQPLVQLPVERHATLIRVFLLHAQSFGFFLNIGRFTNSTLTPEDDTLAPAPALLSSVLLWGVHLSGSQFAQYETFCLAQAVALTAQALATPHPHGVIQYIQSEVLLAHYFFRNNRMIEGKYHTGAAMSLMFSAGFHKIRSVDSSPMPVSLNTMILAPASDLVEEGERINAFWTVVILNSCWSTRESNILYEIVDTPWPLDMQQYSQIYRASDFGTSRTIEHFLANQPSDDTSSDRSIIAQYSKAAILYERASNLGVLYRHDLGPREHAKFLASFTAMQTTIERFGQSLTSIDDMKAAVAPGTAVVVHLLAQSAMIQLHLPVLDVNPNSRGRIVSSIRAVGRILRIVDVTQQFPLESALGTLLALSCRVLVSEVVRGRSIPNHSDEPSNLLEFQMSVMDALKGQSRYFEFLNREVREFYAQNLN